jgi:hypothetical protein
MPHHTRQSRLGQWLLLLLLLWWLQILLLHCFTSLLCVEHRQHGVHPA